MRRVWAALALYSGKHAGIVGAVGLAITLALGLGVTRLEFSTGQDSYLNKDEQTYIDNVEYQGLFGGQAMVSLFTMEEGSTVTSRVWRGGQASTSSRRVKRSPAREGRSS